MKHSFNCKCVIETHDTQQVYLGGPALILVKVPAVLPATDSAQLVQISTLWKRQMIS